MSPLTPTPELGVPLETYLTPKPLLLVAMLSVRSAAKLPPPVNPAPAMICVALPAAAKLDLAPAAVLDPVPPSATAKGIIPLMEPLVMVTPEPLN